MRIELPSGTPAELALPDGPPSRGLALAPDIMGLRPLFEELCAQLAGERGWAVCAPEPFPDHTEAGVEERMELVRTRLDERQVGDLVAAGEVLRERTGVDRMPVVEIGGDENVGQHLALALGGRGAGDHGDAARIGRESPAPGGQHHPDADDDSEN